MRVKIKFKTDSPYYQHGEKERIIDNITEVHYSYKSPLEWKSTAFESDINQTGFTLRNDYIEEFEVLSPLAQSPKG